MRFSDITDFFVNNLTRVIYTAVVIVLVIIVLLVVKVVMNNVVKRNKKNVKRIATISKLVQSMVKYVVIIIAVISLLGIWGINIMPLVAGAGIAGLIIGLGAQDLIKDFLGGINIVFENYFDIGDLVEINGFTGNVTEIGLKTTRLVNWKGELKIFANGQINAVLNYSRFPSVGVVEVDVAYKENLEKVIKILREELESFHESYPQIIEGPNVLGVMNLGESGITLRVTVKTEPVQHYAIERALRKRIKEILDINKIEIPFNQVVVHNANSNKL